MNERRKNGRKDDMRDIRKKQRKKKKLFINFTINRFFLCMELVFRYFFISILALTCHLINLIKKKKKKKELKKDQIYIHK